MKLAYVQKYGAFSVGYLVVNSLLQEVRENDMEWFYLDETGIKLNRFLYCADPAVDILLLVNWDKAAVELVYRRYDKEEGEYTYKIARYLKILPEEIEKLYKFIGEMRDYGRNSKKTSDRLNV